jgi:signal peptidase I
VWRVSNRSRPWSRRSRAPKRPQTPTQQAAGAILEVLVVVATALVLSLVIKTFLLQAFSIPSESMEDTLLIGDRVLVSKLTPKPFALHRGDVIVFTDPGGPNGGWLDAHADVPSNPVVTVLTFVGLLPENYGQHLIKRVIGLPGDTVACCDPQGRLTVNGKPVTEPYIRPGNVPSQEKFSITVKPGNLWVMGDNRSQSADSRSHLYINDGQVPLENVVGKAVWVAWPLGRFGSVTDGEPAFANVPSRP